MPSDVLIIDDDPDILEALQWFLEDEGIRSRAVASVPEVEAALANCPLPSVILLDLYLSGADGRDVCAFLQAEPRTKHVPVIMMSAHPTGHEVANACGVTAYLAKPFDLDHALAVIRSSSDQLDSTGTG